MAWRFAARKVQSSIEEYYEVVEFYEEIGCWTEEPVHITGGTKDQLVQWLRAAAKDIEESDPVDDVRVVE